MSTVAVSPDALREAGDDLVALREGELVGVRPRAHYLHGDFRNENYQHLSTGGFEPGFRCQMRLGELYLNALQTFNCVYQDLVALASAGYILADLYAGGDHEQKLLFAFLEAGPPGWLPDHLHNWEENNSVALAAAQRRHQQALAVLDEDGELPVDWWVRTTPRDGGLKWQLEIVEVYDENDKLVIRRETTTYPDWGGSKEITTRFDENENPTYREVYYEDRTGESTTTIQQGSGGQLETVQKETYTPTDHGGGTTEIWVPQHRDGVVVRDEHGDPVLVKQQVTVHEVTAEQVKGEPTGRYGHSYHTETRDPDDPDATWQREEPAELGPQYPASPPGSHQEAVIEQEQHERELRPWEDREWYDIEDEPEPAPSSSGGGGGSGGYSLIE